jgi:hypothetical protein
VLTGKAGSGAHDPAIMSTNHTMVNARLDDRIGVAAVTYVLCGVKLGPGRALTLVLVFAKWIGWRWLCRNMPPSLGRQERLPSAGRPRPCHRSEIQRGLFQPFRCSRNTCSFAGRNRRVG